MTGFGKPKEMYGPGTKDRLLCIIRKYLTLVELDGEESGNERNRFHGNRWLSGRSGRG